MSRPLVSMAIFVVALAAGAQGVIISDAPNDVEGTTTAGVVIPDASQSASKADLLELSIVEEQDAFQFRVVLRGDSATPVELGPFQLVVHFQHGNSEFLLRLADPSNFVLVNPDAYASLERRAIGTTAWLTASFLNVSTAQGPPLVFAADVARSLITTEEGLVATQGDELTNIYAETRQWSKNYTSVGPAPGPGQVVEWSDRLPDTGAESFSLTFADPINGPVRLSAPRPLRGSNGEETTIVFEVTLSNAGPDPIETILAIEGLPDGWHASTPLLPIELDAGELHAFPVVVATTFAHDHGGRKTFNVTANDVDTGAELARRELGVVYFVIAQPSGHHPVLWIHTGDIDGNRPGFGGEGVRTLPYVNTLDVDTADTGEEIAATEVAPSGATALDWCIPLAPTLAIGLDGDRNAPGLLQVTVESNAPMEGTWGGEIIVTSELESPGFDAQTTCSREHSLVFAELASLDVSLEPQTPLDIELPIHITERGELVPDRQGQGLFLHVTFAATRPLVLNGEDTPFILPGGRLDVPLSEYHESVEGLEAVLDELSISSLTPTSTTRQPGRAALFEFRVENGSGEISLESISSRGEWVDLHSTKVRVGEQFHLSVRVPTDALDGTLLNVVLKATDEEGNVGLKRIVVTVDSLADPTDDGPAINELMQSQSAHAPSVALLGLVLIAFVALRRRPF